MPEPTLTVYANPFHAIDGEGFPSGACARDRLHDRPGYVGASFEVTDVEVLPKDHAGSPRQTTRWVFERGPVTVPDTAHYHAMVRQGALLIGSPEDVEKARAAARELAAERFTRVTKRPLPTGRVYDDEPTAAAAATPAVAAATKPTTTASAPAPATE